MPAMRLIALAALLSASLASAAGTDLAAFSQLPTDPAPPELVRDSHYWVSNEDHLELFHASVKDKGGVYIGVGSDQNYLMAAWARSEVLVLMDFDMAIVDLHRVYRVIFRAAETPADFQRLWKPESRAEVNRLIQEGYEDKAQRAGALRAYGTARWSVHHRLLRVKEQMAKASLSYFFVDAADYAHIRRLYMEDKVFMVRGDLTANKTMVAIGAAAAKAKLKVGVLYLSNAEQYFNYGPQFRANMRALPLDEHSVVVRTSGQRGVTHIKGTYYHYGTQSGASFLAWLEDPKTLDVREMLRFAPDTGKPVGLSRLDQGPEIGRAHV